MKDTLLQYLRQSYSDKELKQWFEPLTITASEEEKSIYISFPHALFSSWFKNYVQDTFEDKVSLFLGPGYVIHYGNNSVPNPADHPTHTTQAKKTDFPFGQSFTFETFLANNKNYFPITSAKEISRQPEVQYNPFVICGGNGAGKTHILRAIANEVSKTHDTNGIFFGTIDDLHAIYTSKFKNDFYASRRFLNKFQFMFVDDFQTIKEHHSMQEELVTLFNSFYDNKKQMVFSCSGKLTSYDFLTPKLKSRLEWGLLINLKEPDLDIRVKYIRKQCKEKKINLTKEQILTLAQRFEDFRYLQGIFLKLFAFKKIMHKNIQEKDFNRILSHTEDSTMEGLDPQKIITVVSEHYEISLKNIMGNRRDRDIVLARQVAMYLCRQLIGCSYPALGKIFGGKDHSTAMYAVKKVNKYQADNQDMKNLLTRLKKRCQLQD